MIPELEAALWQQTLTEASNHAEQLSEHANLASQSKLVAEVDPKPRHDDRRVVRCCAHVSSRTARQLIALGRV